MSFLRIVPMWAWITLLALVAGAGGWLHLQVVSAQRDAAVSELEKTRGEVAALESALEWRRDNAKRLNAALEQREIAIAAAREQIRAHRSALYSLEAEDEETRDWAAQPVPDAVSDWLRDLRDDQNSADPGDANGAAASDGTDPGTSDASDPPARPSDPAG